MRLIRNWRSAPRMLSVQALALIGTIATTQATLSDAVLAMPVPWIGRTLAETLGAAIAGLAVAGIAGRVIDQALSGMGFDPTMPGESAQVNPGVKPKQ